MSLVKIHYYLYLGEEGRELLVHSYILLSLVKMDSRIPFAIMKSNVLQSIYRPLQALMK